MLFILGAGADVTITLNEWLMLGVGAMWTGMGGLDAPGTSTVGLPLRLFIAPFERADGELSRGGLAFFAEVMPGLALSASRGLSRQPVLPNPLVIAAMVGVGYAWW